MQNESTAKKTKEEHTYTQRTCCYAQRLNICKINRQTTKHKKSDAEYTENLLC